MCKLWFRWLLNEYDKICGWVGFLTTDANRGKMFVKRVWSIFNKGILSCFQWCDLGWIFKINSITELKFLIHNLKHTWHALGSISLEFGKQIEFACGPKASKFQTKFTRYKLITHKSWYLYQPKKFPPMVFIITFLLLLSQHYSSQQSGCILFLFLVSRRKGIYSQAPFLLKLSCKHHRLVDDQLIDPSTMRVLKRHRREDTPLVPLERVKSKYNIWFLFLFWEKENIWFL